MARFEMPIGKVASPALRALGESLREAIDALLRIDGDSPELELARQEIDRAAQRLRGLATAENALRLGLASDPAVGRPYHFKGVFLPEHNPLAFPLDVHFEGEALRGTTRLGVVFEGPPGCVHGGFVSALFDQILGQLNLWCGLPAMTGTLSVRYRRPTPLFEELRFEARIRSREGRKIVTEGWIEARDERTAEAEGLFILPQQVAPAAEPASKPKGTKH